MSDYLQRLIERSGPVPATAVRPMLPSRFETVRTGGLHSLVATGPATDDPFAEPSLPNGTPDARARPALAVSPPGETAPTHWPAVSRPDPAAPARVRGAAPGPASEAPPSPVPVAVPFQSVDTREIRTAPVATPTKGAGARAGWEPAAPVAPVPSKSRENGYPSAPGRRTPSPAITPVAARLAGQQGNRVADGFPADRHAPVAPPIQVTIGRIEVRAVLPAAPTPTRRAGPAGPKLSLADYLRTRPGGHR